MSDYISRQAAIEAVDECTKLKITDDFYTVYTEDMKDMITDIPAADVRENVKACWQIGESNKQRRHAGMFCSNCGFEVCSADKGWNVYVDDHYHYCPNCGADMRGEE